LGTSPRDGSGNGASPFANRSDAINDIPPADEAALDLAPETTACVVLLFSAVSVARRTVPSGVCGAPLT
jgi:hypothetical protein